MKAANQRHEFSRRTVFVVGAGLSADLGYPLTRDLLFGLVPRFDERQRRTFQKFVQFHHPGWKGRPETLPDVEELLTELVANEDLLSALRPRGPFGPKELETIREDLLIGIAEWFHEIHKRQTCVESAVGQRFLSRLADSGPAVIISFNWDLELDRGIFESDLQSVRRRYGLESGPMPELTLLKPHGSLNWYPHKTGRHFESDRSELLWEPSDPGDKGFEPIHLFKKWRGPRTKHDRRYVPWIVPPTQLKRFEHPMLRLIWGRSVEALSTATKIFFLGYSLPIADWHSRYIFRCGVHNQVEGMPNDRGKESRRAHPTGLAKVVIVNPENAALRRIETVLGMDCVWIPKTIARWLSNGD